RYRGEAYRGYQASKKRYFYGLKLHLLVTAQAEPVEFFLTPGSWADVTGLDCFDFDLPAGSQIIGDKAYNDYELEDVLKMAGLDLLPMRKANSKRPVPPWTHYLQAHYRKAVETAGSLLERLLPKHIHAVTAQGFELKVVLFVIAFGFHRLPLSTLQPELILITARQAAPTHPYHKQMQHMITNGNPARYIAPLDMDDTLLNSEGVLSPRTLDTLRRWRPAAHPTVIATGRPPRS